MEFIIGLATGFVLLIITKTIAEPLAIWVGKLILGKAYKLIPKVFDELDDWLPQSQGKDVGKFLVETAIPLVAQSEGVDLDEDKIMAIADAVIKNFKLGAFNAKLR